MPRSTKLKDLDHFKNFHIGQLIRAQMNQTGTSVATVAANTGFPLQRVKLLLKKKSMDAKDLVIFCDVLEYNFFFHLVRRPDDPRRINLVLDISREQFLEVMGIAQPDFDPDNPLSGFGRMATEE